MFRTDLLYRSILTSIAFNITWQIPVAVNTVIRLLMKDSKSVRNMWSYFFTKIKLRNSASCWLLLYWCACYGCPILIKLELSQQLFGKYWNIKFLEIRSVGAEFFQCGQTGRRTDRHDETQQLLFEILRTRLESSW
jgi:hypothetical protein